MEGIMSVKMINLANGIKSYLLLKRKEGGGGG